MKKLVVGALLALAFAAGPASAEEWHIIAPIQAQGHQQPFAVYNEDPYDSVDMCFEALASDEFLETFDLWQEAEWQQHKGEVSFGRPGCVPAYKLQPGEDAQL